MRNTTQDTVALFGLPITNVSMEQAVARVEELILSGATHQVATANLDFVRNSLHDQYLQRIICECSMVLPEGAPMVWASMLFRTPLQERVTSVDLIPELARLSAERGYGIYLLGASEESSQRTVEALEIRFPGVRMVGWSSPRPKPLHEMDNDRLLRSIEEANPDILLVAFGSPKQEIWIHRHRDRLRVPVAIGIGGALDSIGDQVGRTAGWSLRRMREPLRSIPRYAKDAAALLRHLPLGLAANRLQPGDRRQGLLKVEVEGTVRVVATPSTLSGEVSAWLAKEAKAAVGAGQTMVVDMSSTLRVEADGLGGLLEARRILLNEGLWIWLAGMSNPVRRVLQFSAISDLFRIAASTPEAIRFTTVARAPMGRITDPQSGTGRGKPARSASIARAG